MSRLSITKVAIEAAWRCWGLRRELFSVMIIPIAGFVAIGVGTAILDVKTSLTPLIYTACFLIVSTFAAVSCHRVLLLGPVSVPKFGVGGLGARERHFLSALLFVAFSTGVLRLIGDIVANSLLGIDDNADQPFLVRTVAALPASYLFARLALMLPSIAVERPVSIRQSWQLSKGNGWRLALLIVFLPWFVRLAEWGLTPSMPGEAAAIVSITLYAVFLPLEISLLSVSYRHLTE